AMNWPAIGVLRGPDVGAACPVLEVEVDLRDVAEDGARVAAAIRRLRTWVPDLEGEDVRQDPALSLARTLQRLTLVLQRQAGSPVWAGFVRPSQPAGAFRVAVQFEE